MEDDNISNEALIVALTPAEEIIFVESKLAFEMRINLLINFYLKAEDNNSSQSASGSPSHVSAPATSRYGLFQATLKIKNTQADKAVLFRVRTTSPANYRVKPAYGRIEPSEEQEVKSKERSVIVFV